MWSGKRRGAAGKRAGRREEEAGEKNQGIGRIYEKVRRRRRRKHEGGLIYERAERSV
jgi:hypothetical protein